MIAKRMQQVWQTRHIAAGRGLLWTLAGLLSMLAGSAAGAPMGALQITVVDGAGKGPLPSRIHIYDEDGNPLELKEGVGFQWYAPQLQAEIAYRGHITTDGQALIPLPVGTYRVVVERGKEYYRFETEAEVKDKTPIKIEAKLDRFIDMAAKGWYSADLHIHRPFGEMAHLQLSDDLHLAPLCTWWNGRSTWGLGNPPEAAWVQFDATHGYHLLGQEIERIGGVGRGGALLFFDLDHFVPCDFEHEGPPNSVYCEAAHAQGGVVDADKPFWPQFPVGVALGHFDSVQLAHNHFHYPHVWETTRPYGAIDRDMEAFPQGGDNFAKWTFDLYYKILECGFRVVVSAGSASGVMPSPVGYERVYAYLGDQPFDHDNWWEAFRAGRTMATNGPLLFMTVDGQLPGAEVAGNRKVPVAVEAVGMDPLDRVEIVVQGQVVAQLRPGADPRRIEGVEQIELPGSGFVAARVFESRTDGNCRFAHTGPVYYRTDGVSEVVPEAAAFWLKHIDDVIEATKNVRKFSEEAHRQAELADLEKARAIFAELTGTQ